MQHCTVYNYLYLRFKVSALSLISHLLSAVPYQFVAEILGNNGLEHIAGSPLGIGLPCFQSLSSVPDVVYSCEGGEETCLERPLP